MAEVLASAVDGQAALGAERLSNQAVQRFLEQHSADGAAPSIGARLPAELATRYGDALGQDFSGVRVHTDAAAARAAADCEAQAFALGAALFFGAHAPRPGSPKGDALLAHELAHVAQHEEGRLEGLAAKAEAPGSASALEQEADAAAAQAAGLQPEEEGWLVDQVRQISPLLAAVLTDGVEATFGDDLLTLVGEWVASQAPDVDLAALTSAFTTGLGEALQLLAGAAQGDLACCEKLSALACKLTGLVTDWSKAEGPLFRFRDEIEGFGQWALTAFAGIMQTFLDRGAELAIAIGIDQMASNVESWLAEKGAVLSAAIEQGLAWMELPSLDALPGWIVGKLGAVVEGAASVGSGTLDLVAQGVMQIPGLDQLATVGDALVLAGEAAAWMAANRGNEEIWKTEGEALRAHYGGLATAMQLAMETGSP